MIEMQYYYVVSKSSIIKTFTVLFALAFLMVQGVSQAHATEHGDEDHTHDGVACDIMLVAAQQIVATPPVPVPAPFKAVSKSNWTIIFDKGRPRTFDSRAPPPRAPPAH